MRLLVTSDTHLNAPNVHGALASAAGDADAVVHAGDFESLSVLRWFEDRGKLYAVHGNADDGGVCAELPRRTTFEADGVRVCVVHGHRATEVGYEAAETGASLVVRGHTHTPSYKERGFPTLNPGSPTRPRSSPPSYAWLVCRDGEYGGRIVSLGDDTLVEFGEEL